MEGTLTGAERHPRLAKRLVFDDEYMMTEKEIGEVFDRWRKEAAENPEKFATPEELAAGTVDIIPSARFFLDTLAEIRCEAIGLL